MREALNRSLRQSSMGVGVTHLKTSTRSVPLSDASAIPQVVGTFNSEPVKKARRPRLLHSSRGDGLPGGVSGQAPPPPRPAFYWGPGSYR